ncbi:beta-N-acetylhexosaminidase [Occultella glacieicola]|uniref:Beta-N-acetylhexosaminidase n=2 Tax=Occultella glacieicola TaxID=2518684 RepID=A0ABY2E803_9MICO|nr:beta-N-acetylhexosaminidase [Occultella glacieicola]
MSPEEVAGQVLLARYPGTDPAAAAAALTAHHLAGLVLFSENVASVDQVAATGSALQAAQAESGRDWPAAFAVDNEGGLVQRLGAAAGPWTSFPTFMSAGAADDPAVTSAAAEAMALELRASGLNYDFAPDADVTVGPADVTIGMRAASSDPERAARAVTAATAGFTAGGVISSVKHFPGHGSLTVDSHQGLPVQGASAAELAARDLVPFERAVDAGAPTVMMGHIAVEAWDPGVPASVSPEAYRVLREDLGFTGVAITDGLDMGALTQTWSSAEIAVLALQAGADLLLGPVDVPAAHAGIVAALADGSLGRDRVDEAAGRVIALMRWQAAIAADAQAVTTADVGSAAPASLALSAAAITQVAGQCGRALAGDTIHVRGGSRADWDGFVAAAEAAGLDVVALEQPADTDVRLLTGATPSGSADVAVLLDEPWLLTETDAPTRLAVYGRTAQAFEAVAAVLTGAAPAPGTLPVEVSGLPATVC